MNEAMMQQLLATYGGAPLTVENMNRIRMFGASNPDVLERRAQGMRGSGNQDNSDLLQLLMDATAGGSGGAAVTDPSMTMPSVQQATMPTRRSATAAPTMPPRQGNYGPGPSPTRQLGYDGATMPPGPLMSESQTSRATMPSYPLMSESQTGGGQAETQIPGMLPAPPPPIGDNNLFGIILKALLGTSAAGALAGATGQTQLPDPNIPPARQITDGSEGRPGTARRGGVSDVVDENERVLSPPARQLPGPNSQIEGPNAQLPPPNGRITSNVGPNMESVGAEMQTVQDRNATSRNAREAAIRADVDAENEALMRQIMEQNAREAAQQRTRDLFKAGKRVTGRK